MHIILRRENDSEKVNPKSHDVHIILILRKERMHITLMYNEEYAKPTYRPTYSPLRVKILSILLTHLNKPSVRPIYTTVSNISVKVSILMQGAGTSKEKLIRTDDHHAGFYFYVLKVE